MLTGLSLSLNITAERKMVTSGQAKMMESASGTSIKETEASELMKAIDPVSPEINKTDINNMLGVCPRTGNIVRSILVLSD